MQNHGILWILVDWHISSMRWVHESQGTLEKCPDTQNAYFLGELAAEALVATFGAKSLNDFQMEFGRSGDWKAAFEKIFGLKVDDFYLKLTPYLASQARKLPN